MLHGERLLNMFKKVVFSILLIYCFVSLSFADTEYLIPVPEDCLKVAQISTNKIYLVKDKTICTGIPMVKVSLPDSIETVDIYINGKFYKKHAVKDKNLEQAVARLNVKPDDSIQMPKNKEAEQKAFESYYYTQTEEYQKNVDKYKEDIKKMIFPEQQASLIDKFYPDAKTKKSVLSEDERVYVFISSSIPEQTLRAYAIDLEKLGKHAVLVMRGAIGGLKYIKPTAEWSTRILKKNPYCEGQCETFKTKIIIDPFLFRKYGIDRVPAVVYAKGIQNLDGLSEGLIKSNNFSLISYGDVALSYHFQVMAEKSKLSRLKDLSEMLK